MLASGFSPNAVLSIDDLRGIADRVTGLYRESGYFLAQVYLPPQDITEGHVRFRVVEGQYGKIQLQNRARLTDAVAWSMLDDLKTAGAVNDADLERSLLQLTDLPGVKARSVLAPGAVLGTTDLLVDLTPGPGISGSLEADSGGSRYTGSNRVGGNIAIHSPLGIGDMVTARVLSAGDGMAYGRLSYQLPWGRMTTGVAVTALKYSLGAEFSTLQASGTARIDSGFANYSLQRSRLFNLSAQVSLDNKSFVDQLSDGLLVSKKSVRNNNLALKGDYRDSLGLRNSNYALTWTRGDVSLHDTVAVQTDAATARTEGIFDKLAVAWSYQQSVTSSIQLSVDLSGQWSSKNLDTSEKFSLGGATGVRAYPAGEASGDEGVLFALELRTSLQDASNALGGQLQLVGFLDAGRVVTDKQPWDTSGKNNERALSGAGLGLLYTSAQKWTVRAYAATKLGADAAVSAPDLPVRVWLQASKLFN